MNVGDLVKIKKTTTWEGDGVPSTAIIVEVISPIPSHSGRNRYRIHTGEVFFDRDLELLRSQFSSPSDILSQ